MIIRRAIMSRDSKKLALSKLSSQGSSFTTKEARSLGVQWQDISRLKEEGDLLELSRGVYRLASAQPTPYIDFVAVSKRSPHAAICLTSALWYWDLTDEMPIEVHLAVPRGSTRPRITQPATRIHLFDPDTFTLGLKTVTLETGEELRIYSKERTVVDAMRLRHRIGSDIAIESLRRYLQERQARPAELLEIARQLRAEEPISAALKVLLH